MNASKVPISKVLNKLFAFYCFDKVDLALDLHPAPYWSLTSTLVPCIGVIAGLFSAFAGRRDPLRSSHLLRSFAPTLAALMRRFRCLLPA